MASRSAASQQQQQQQAQQQAQQAAAQLPHVPLSYPLVPQVSPHFSLQRVFSEHVGIMRVKRLLFIGERCPALAVEALRLALQELKAAQPQRTYAKADVPSQLSAPAQLGPNPSLYAETVQRAQQLLLTPTAQPEHAWFLSAGSAAHVESDPVFSVDQTFYAQLNSTFAQAQHALEGALTQQRRDGEREGIRVASLNLAEMYLNRGDLTQALNKYMEAKEFVTPQAGSQQQQEMLHIALAIIRASILAGPMSHVKGQVQRAERIVKECRQQPSGQGQQGNNAAASASSASGPSDAEQRELNVISCKLKAAHGLYHMKSGSFHSAASCFVSVSSDLGSSYADVLSSADCVLYGSICALASFSRRELKEHVLNNLEFKKLLETHAPNTWKMMLQQFYNSDYAKVLEGLESIKSDLYLDLYLSQHVNRLIKFIRERAFVQYFQAYVVVSLPSMSAAFNLSVPQLERTLADLIGEGKIAARIDSHTKVLHATHADARSDTFSEAMATGAAYARDVRALLLRLSLVEHDVAVRGSAQEHKRKTGFAPAGANAGGARMAASGGGDDAMEAAHTPRRGGL